MPAHGALRELERAAQLPHRQLVAVEQQEEPAPGGVGERREAVEEGAGLYHPYIRMKGCLLVARRQGAGSRSAVPGRVQRSDRESELRGVIGIRTVVTLEVVLEGGATTASAHSRARCSGARCDQSSGT